MEQLKKYLEKRGMTQKQFSAISGISESHLCRILQGSEPKISTVLLIRAATRGQVRPEHWAKESDNG